MPEIQQKKEKNCWDGANKREWRNSGGIVADNETFSHSRRKSAVKQSRMRNDPIHSWKESEDFLKDLHNMFL